jgi:hypothetical protein
MNKSVEMAPLLIGKEAIVADTMCADGHRRLSVSWILILPHVTGKKHPKLPRFSTLFKGLARDPKIPSCIY